MYTLGYAFRPWTEAKAIADGPSILSYVRETAARLRHRPRRSASATGSCAPSGRPRTRAGRWRSSAATTARPCASPAASCSCAAATTATTRATRREFAGTERFGGRIVHPQHWPEDIDYAGKRVVVIGSGATAVTLVPAMAESAAHVTMLQRSPTYIVALPARGPDREVRAARPADQARLCRGALEERADHDGLLPALPAPAGDDEGASSARGWSAGFPPGTTSTPTSSPRYNPWDQRLCLVPDGDLFEAIGSGRRVGRHRPHRDVHRERASAGVRRGARGRPRRHRHRPEPDGCSAA